MICLLFFAYLNRDGCFLYCSGWRGVGFFLFLALWLLLFLGSRFTGRVILAGLAVLLAFVYEAGGFVGHVAAAESSAVVTLRALRNNLENAKVQHPQQGYPERLPADPPPFRFRPAYRFAYIPTRNMGEAVASYRIEATPVRPMCGCAIRSFTIADDGRIYVTMQKRPATTSDLPLH